jgi:hypothetical protein
VPWAARPCVGGFNRSHQERKEAGTVALQAPTGNLSLNVGHCTFVYEEPREAKLVVRAEAEDTTVSALSVFPQRSPENRPNVVTSKPAKGRSRELGCFNLPPPEEASLFLCANCGGHTSVRDRDGGGDRAWQ